MRAFGIALVLAALSPIALASSVTATYDGMSPKAVVSLQLNGVNHTVYGGTSQFEVLSRHDANDAFSPYLAELPEVFTGYCIDFNQRIHFNSTFTWEFAQLAAAPVPGQAMGPTRAGMLSWLHDNASHGVEFQLAVWEILNEDVSVPGSLDIAGGAFRALNPNQYNADLLGKMLGDLNALDWSQLAADPGLVALTSGQTQDFMTFIDLPNPPPPGGEVPEPVTLLGGLIGCGAVGRYLRRRRA